MGFIGTGCTITFDSGFCGEILSIGGPEPTREAVDMSHMGTAGGKPFDFDDMYDGGELSVELAFEPKDAPGITTTKETVTIAWADSAATSWSFTGALIRMGPTTPVSGRATATAVIKVDGDINFAA